MLLQMGSLAPAQARLPLHPAPHRFQMSRCTPRRARCRLSSSSSSELNTASPSGLRWKDLRQGKGPEPTLRSTVRCHYTGRFPTDGRVFDSSYMPLLYSGGGPLSFTVGVGMVIKGWDLGILGSEEEGIPPMKEGGKRLLLVPAELAYGAKGFLGVIPPDADLEFEVELLGPPGFLAHMMGEVKQLWGELNSGV